MGLIATENLSPGMALEKDVHDRSGRLLLGAGTELTGKHIHILHTWGVVEVAISGIEEDKNPCPLDGGIDPDTWAAAEAEIKPLFRHNDPDHPAIKELMRICALRKIKHGIR